MGSATIRQVVLSGFQCSRSSCRRLLCLLLALLSLEGEGSRSAIRAQTSHRHSGDGNILLVSERSNSIPWTACPPYMKTPKAPSTWDFRSEKCIMTKVSQLQIAINKNYVVSISKDQACTFVQAVFSRVRGQSGGAAMGDCAVNKRVSRERRRCVATSLIS